MKLRDYQRRSIDLLYSWFEKNSSGHPCVVLPTGAGKSVIIASLIREAIQSWPETRVLMLCHVKELLEQNYEKIKAVWSDAPVGIYSAGIGKKQLGMPITVAGVQSIYKKTNLIGHIDLCIVDECHVISHKEEGSYRALINGLLLINPNMRIIGYSATPFRLGHGLITDKPAIFDALIEPTSIEELVYHGYLSPLRSKLTKSQLDTTGVHKRGGEFIESELQAAVNKPDKNSAIVDEVISLAGDRRSWLFFCAGVDHAYHIKDALVERGIYAECITGATPKTDRESILAAFKRGEIQALTNANVLTVGFDSPNIDLIAMLRPTMSPGLYMQMAGRGMRLKEHTDHCLVLDFAGVVQTHGPITAVNTPEKAGEGGGEAPIKVCDECAEIVHAAARKCPQCGAEFPEPKPKSLILRNDCIMGQEDFELECKMWAWSVHTSRTSGKTMLKVTYYGNLSDAPIKEYLCINHDGYTGQRAMRTLGEIAVKSNAGNPDSNMLDSICQVMNQATPPIKIEYKKSGKFFEVTNREWL